jgi:predicted Rossmann-fold nucleotide-binding protein
MPDGLATLDESTEVLTSIQTGKIKPFPIVPFSVNYWTGFLGWLRASVWVRGFISYEGLGLVRVYDSTETVIYVVKKWYTEWQVRGTKAIAQWILCWLVC